MRITGTDTFRIEAGRCNRLGLQFSDEEKNEAELDRKLAAERQAYAKDLDSKFRRLPAEAWGRASEKGRASRCRGSRWLVGLDLGKGGGVRASKAGPIR